MALTPSVGSASALLRTANSLATQVSAYEDARRAFEFSNSGYTDTAYQTYSDYLSGRISSLSAAGGITNAQKALSLTSSLRSASRSNTSASITRENIQIMAGNASLPDKYSLISSQFVRAINNQDYTLAQSLESQAYSVSQQIQYQQQQSAAAGLTLAKAGASRVTKGQEDVASNLETSLKQFNKDFATVGQKSQQSTLDKFVKSIKPQLDALHIVLPKGATPNYFDVVEGVSHAIYQAHSYAAMALAPYDESRAQDYQDKANAVVTGDKKFGTLSGSLSLQEIQDSAGELAAGHIAYNATTGGFGKAEIPVPKGSTATGFTFVPNQGVQIQKSATAFTAPSPELGAQLTALGLQYGNSKSTASQGEQVQVTQGSPDFLKKYVKPGTLLNVFQVWNPATKSFMLQFKGDAASGPGSSVYSIIQDASGKHGLVEEGQEGTIIHGGVYGFNPAPKAEDSRGFFSRVGHSLSTGIQAAASGMLNLFGGHASASGMIYQSQVLSAKIAEANRLAAAAMLAYTPPPLPNVGLAPAPALPNIAPAPPKVLSAASYPVAPRTINPQTPGSVTLQGGPIRTQGGSVDLFKGGGTGIRL